MSERLGDSYLLHLEKAARYAESIGRDVSIKPRNIMAMRDEIIEIRAHRLSPSDLAALQWLHVQALAIQHDRSQAGSDGFPDPARAVEVLERLIAAGGGK